MAPAGIALLLVGLPGCQAPVVKSEAIASQVLATPPAKSLVSKSRGDERILTPDPAWMELDSNQSLTFAGYRSNPKRPAQVLYSVVVTCDPAKDLLVLLPLAKHETPLTVLANPGRQRTLEKAVRTSRPSAAMTLSLRKTIDEKRLASPLPTPGRIFAAAANYPSHGLHDLAADPEVVASFSNSRARVFQKFPPVAPPEPGLHTKTKSPFHGVVGPFDTIRYPDRLQLPGEYPDDPEDTAHPAVDYEVEVGVVIGRELRGKEVHHMSDGEIMRHISGYLLVSDSKARNPQMFCKARNRNRPPPETETPYMVGDDFIDRVLGRWDANTCQWWSYAASWGDYAALGPFFVAAPRDHSFPERNIITARSYAAPATRGVDIPAGVETGPLYVRQASTATTRPDHPDRLIWQVPDLIRSLLAPDSALDIGGPQARLRPGDIIATGTPGGTVITASSQAFYKATSTMLFWWDADQWHDKFFGKDEELYLHPGDEVFFWAEGLGCQQLDIQRTETR